MLCLPLLVCLGLLVTALPCQQTRAAAAAARQQQVAPGSDEWLLAAVDHVDALLELDAPAALRAAEELRILAAADGGTGWLPTATILLAFVTSRVEGPQAARNLLAEASSLPEDASAAVRACHHLAMARTLCNLGEHANELQWSIPAQVAAEDCSDPVLQVRTAMATLNASPRRDLAMLRRAFAHVDAAGHAAAVEFHRPWLWFEELQLADKERKTAVAKGLDRQIDAAADAHGNLRLRAVLLTHRARVLVESADFPRGIAGLQAALATWQQLGDRTEVAVVNDLIAYCHLRQGELPEAEARLAAAESEIAGRGYAELEREILRGRLELAVRRRDGDAAAGFADELERRLASSQVNSQALAEARSRLDQLEQQHAAAVLARDAELVEQQRQAQQASLRSQIQLAGLGLVAALLVLGVSLRSRRRLQVVNRALAEQVQAVEAARQQQQQLAARLQQQERAESLQAMAAGIAHDFNNLLTAILGNAQLIRLNAGEAAVLAQLDEVEVAARKAAQLCRQLQVGEINCDPPEKLLPLHAVCTELLRLLQAQLACRIELIPAADSAVLTAPVARADWEQIVLALVRNAADAKACCVRLQLRCIADDAGSGQAMVELEVVDDGEGMSAPVRERIFDPFFTTRFAGRGLGLAAVHALVRRLGGSIQVESAVGCGSRFVVRLPQQARRLAEIAASRPAVIEVQRRQEALQLLVVDDEPAVRKVAVRMLRDAGYAVAEFADGPALLAALQVLPAAVPVCVLADLGMPGMDGREVLQQVRRIRPDAGRVLISGHPAEYLGESAADADRTLCKPFVADELLAALVGLPPGRNSAAPDQVLVNTA